MIKRVMREFADENGQVWVGTVQEQPGDDYKGRVFFVSGRQLDRYVVWDYVTRRRQIIA